MLFRSLQYSCLENSRDRGAWWDAIYGVAQNRTPLKRLSMIGTAEELVTHVTRMTLGDLPIAVDGNIKTAVLYAVAYLYEHREDADLHHLMMNLRYLLFGVREPAF